MRLRKFFGEIHRRGVWQVLGSYAVVAWIILQLAETLGGLIGLPLWFGPAIVVVVLLGFPVFLVTALTQGVRKPKEAGSEGFWDSANGGDDALTSWRSLDGSPLRDALARVFTWRNALLGGLVMAVGLTVGSAGYSGLRSAGVGDFGSLVAKGVFEANEQVILADFEDMTSDGTLGETVTTLLRIDLNQSSSIDLLERSELSPALARMERDPTEPLIPEVAVELAQREGIKAVVEGEVLPLGPGAVVSARLVVAHSGETLVALRETARTIDAVPDAVDRLSAQLRERIGESLRSIQGDPPLEEVTTSSIEALRKYVQAEWALNMGDVATAEALVKEAIALDTTFSMAYRKLGVILSNEARSEEEAREAFSRAYEERGRLPERERLLAEATYHTYVSEELDAAIDAYEEILDAFPSDGIAGNNLAVLYGENDEPEKAAELYLKSIARGRAPPVSYTNAVSTLFSMGQADSAAAILDRFREAYPDHPQFAQYSAALSSARFDYSAAEGWARELMAAQEGNALWKQWGELELANYALVRGKINEGAERMIRAQELQNEAGTRFTEQPKFVFEALGMASIQLYFLQDPDGAVQLLEQLLGSPEFEDLSPVSRSYLDLAGMFAQAGRPGRSRDMLEAFREEVPAEIRQQEKEVNDLLFLEAALALADGDPAGAARMFRAAREATPRCDFCGIPELGEAFEAAAMPDSAVAVYEDYLSADVLFRSQSDNMKLHRVLVGLARSHEALDQPLRAAEYYRRLLGLWSQADPGLAPMVRDLEGKLRRVEGAF